MILLKYIKIIIILVILLGGCNTTEPQSEVEKEINDLNKDKEKYYVSSGSYALTASKTPGYSEDSEDVEKLYHGEKIKVIKKHNNYENRYTWWKIYTPKGNKAWVPSEFLIKEEPISMDEVEEINNLIHEAESYVSEYFTKAFAAEFFDNQKIPFSEHENKLKKYYTEDEVENLKKFYNNKLSYWGYELHVVFPFCSLKRLNNKPHKFIEKDNKIEVVFFRPELQTYSTSEHERSYYIITINGNDYRINGISCKYDYYLNS